MSKLFLFAGGGTGGHVYPSLAVARELTARGHRALFIGTQRGVEARLVPAHGFPIEFIEIGGLKRVGWRRQITTFAQLPLASWRVLLRIHALRPGAVFSMGGFVAGPAVLAALLARVPVLAMEPNAVPGLTNLRLGRRVARTLVAFESAARFFPAGRCEITGLPVREEFFALPPKPPGGPLHVLVTGGSRGSRTLNEASRLSWPLFRDSGLPIRFTLQCGRDDADRLREAFAATGLPGEVVPFLDDMSEAFAMADVVVCRAGAGAVFELAAAGKPAILVPFPYAADQHQLRNAEVFSAAGAAILLPDAECTGERLFEAIAGLASNAERTWRMGVAARSLARRGAAQRAATLLEELSAVRTRGLTDDLSSETIQQGNVL